MACEKLRLIICCPVFDYAQNQSFRPRESNLFLNIDKYNYQDTNKKQILADNQEGRRQGLITIWSQIRMTP